ncbi:amidase family protein, partial [Ramlibacter sp.]|uniref:amidase family protein n=1 Tax=Ramlibacter sp. TaxID=1917967 RepID=UPI00182E96D5
MIALPAYAAHDATGLAQLLRRGEVSPAELAQCARAAVELLNPRLNAVVGPLSGDGAASCEHDAHGPLAGVPFLVKDLVLRARGLPCQMGSRLLADAPAALADASLMARFRHAGFMTLGRTNAAEFGYSVTTEPVLHGPVRNPWDPGLSAGGSSGGAAAAVA